MASVAATKQRSFRQPQPASRLKLADAGLLTLVLALAITLMAHSGFKRGVELMPWPDGLEYAAVAVNLDSGRGPVLHFGGYSYPSRYSEGYPLMLAAARPLLGGAVDQLLFVTLALGLLAIAALYVVALELFGRLSALVAAIMLACSPTFISYSTMVLSDVPALAVVVLAVLALTRASHEPGRGAPSGTAAAYLILSAALAGFAVMIRPTNSTLLLGVGLALVAIRNEPGLRWVQASVKVGIPCAAAFTLAPLWQLLVNWKYLGGALRSGYTFWVPEVYGSFAKIFNADFLFGATMPRNPHGNFPVYSLALLGLDRLLGDPAAPPFFIYPWAGAIFAAIGTFHALKSPPNRAARVVTAFGLGFLAALVGVYLFYFFSDVVFILPAAFILFAMAGYGATLANRAMKAAWDNHRRTARQTAVIAATILLDLGLTLALGGEVVQRLQITPRASRVVPTLQEINTRLPTDAEVLSNVSLQFLELYLPGEKRQLIGLHSFEADNDLSDYHLNRLYVKRTQGWSGPLPPVLFEAGGKMNSSLAASIGKGRPTYLLLAAPNSADYAAILRDDVAKLRESFDFESVLESGPVVLYRLQPR